MFLLVYFGAHLHSCLLATDAFHHTHSLRWLSGVVKRLQLDALETITGSLLSPQSTSPPLCLKEPTYQ